MTTSPQSSPALPHRQIFRLNLPEDTALAEIARRHAEAVAEHAQRRGTQPKQHPGRLLAFAQVLDAFMVQRTA